jgi:hypothetical protein
VHPLPGDPGIDNPVIEMGGNFYPALAVKPLRCVYTSLIMTRWLYIKSWEDYSWFTSDKRRYVNQISWPLHLGNIGGPKPNVENFLSKHIG